MALSKLNTIVEAFVAPKPQSEKMNKKPEFMRKKRKISQIKVVIDNAFRRKTSNARKYIKCS